VYRLLWIFTAALFLSSCTTINPPSTGSFLPWKKRAPTLSRIQNWQLNGKIALQTAEEAGSAMVSWQQHQDQFNLTLSGPLGMNPLQLSGQPGRVTLLTANGKKYEAESPEQLLSQQWGWHLPLSHLHYWIRGLPAPGIPSLLVWDKAQHVSQLKQANFDIQYIDYIKVADSYGVVDLPSRITIVSPFIKIKIIVYEWKLG
jgi:outer membrane lipoprotein LolB